MICGIVQCDCSLAAGLFMLCRTQVALQQPIVASAANVSEDTKPVALATDKTTAAAASSVYTSGSITRSSREQSKWLIVCRVSTMHDIYTFTSLGRNRRGGFLKPALSPADDRFCFFPVIRPTDGHGK